MYLQAKRDTGTRRRKNLMMMDLLWNLLNDNEKSRINKKKWEAVKIREQKVSERSL